MLVKMKIGLGFKGGREKEKGGGEGGREKRTKKQPFLYRPEHFWLLLVHFLWTEKWVEEIEKKEQQEQEQQKQKQEKNDEY